jgi:glyoxylase-like metal-dependent hydrolase (beta-lactamase superfamily II)
VTYTGDVSVGGPPAVRELDELRITKLAVGPLATNAYLLESRSTDQRLLVDAGDDAPALLALLGGRALQRVVTTHRHPDHWQALGEVVAATGARTAAGALDADGVPVATDDPLRHGDEVWVGDVGLRVLHLRGHTPGSVALLHEAADGSTHLLTGDALFPGGPGRTRSPEDFTALMDDLEREVFGPLPDETRVYPGHGADTTLGAERGSVPTWRARGW